MGGTHVTAVVRRSMGLVGGGALSTAIFNPNPIPSPNPKSGGPWFGARLHEGVEGGEVGRPPEAVEERGEGERLPGGAGQSGGRPRHGGVGCTVDAYGWEGTSVGMKEGEQNHKKCKDVRFVSETLDRPCHASFVQFLRDHGWSVVWIRCCLW